MNLTAVAAFIAAGLSFVNVVATYRLNRRTHLDEWRRNEERPIVARLLRLSADAGGEWAQTALEKMRLADLPEGEAWEGALANAGEHFGKGMELLKSVQYEAAQLDMLAGQRVRKTAAELVQVHGDAALRVNPAKNYRPVLPSEQLDAARRLHDRLVEATRADTGVGVSGGPVRRARLRWHWRKSAMSEGQAERLAGLRARYGKRWSIDPRHPGSTTFVAIERMTGHRIMANLVELGDKLEQVEDKRPDAEPQR